MGSNISLSLYIVHAIIEQILLCGNITSQIFVNVVFLLRLLTILIVLEDVLLKTKICWLSLKLVQVHIKNISADTEREQDRVNLFSNSH